MKPRIIAIASALAAALSVGNIFAQGSLVSGKTLFPKNELSEEIISSPLNISRDFYSLMEMTPILDQYSIEKLKQFKVIFVPGFTTRPNLNDEFIMSDSKTTKTIKTLQPNYFDEQIIHIRSLGIDTGIVDLASTGDSIEKNAERISDAIAKSDKKVIVIAHSKGGIDTLETLRAYPKLHEKIQFVLMVQSPFLGTPLSDYILNTSILDYAAKTILERMGGTKESLKNLSIADRLEYHKKHAFEISQIIKKVNLISLTSYKKRSSFDTLTVLLRDAMSRRGILNDGFVPTESAILPESRYIVLDEVDHLCSVLKVRRPGFDRIKFIEAVLFHVVNK